MTKAPVSPKVYHITHVDNLASILANGVIWCDAGMTGHGGPAAPIGMSSIKARRLNLPVRCHPGDSVGDYVPFYFCPRSIMLYLLHMGNHPELSYRGGQGPILHLEADLHKVVDWAIAVGRRWAFSLTNAGGTYAEFRSSLRDLGEIDWAAVAATDFRDPMIKEGKQAEFLLHESFPWQLIERIGVKSVGVRTRVSSLLSGTSHCPPVQVMPTWYY